MRISIVQPENWIEAFAKAGAAVITVHQEACTHLQRTLQLIRSFGVKAGVSLNPATSEETLRYVLNDVDLVLVMSVNPGFGGQSFLRSQLPKIARIREMLNEAGNTQCHIQVDGGVNPQNAPECIAAGADVLVAGSAVFKGDYQTNIAARYCKHLGVFVRHFKWCLLLAFVFISTATWAHLETSAENGMVASAHPWQGVFQY